MSVWECPACGHEYKCPPSKEYYEHYEWEFWCFGPEVIHGNKSRVDREKSFMNTFIRHASYYHIPMRMKCTNSKGLGLYTKELF